MSPRPLSPERTAELVNNGRMELEVGSNFYNVHLFADFFIDGGAVQSLNKLKVGVQEAQGQKGNSLSQDEFYDLIDDLKLNFAYGMYIYPLLEHMDFDTLETFLQQHLKLITAVAVEDVVKQLVKIQDNLTSEYDVAWYVGHLEQLARAFMSVGVNPFDFSLQENTAS